MQEHTLHLESARVICTASDFVESGRRGAARVHVALSPQRFCMAWLPERSLQLLLVEASMPCYTSMKSC